MAHTNSRRLRVVLATRIYEPEGAAAAHRLGNLVRALEAAGHQVTVLTTKAPGARRSTRQVRRWPVLRDRSGSVRGYVQYLSFDIPLFLRLLFVRRADVVVVEPPPTTGLVSRIACAIRRIPYVYYSADVLTNAVSGIGSARPVVGAVRWLETHSLKGAGGVLAVSDDVKSEVTALGAAADRITVVGTGIDTEKFTPEGPTPEAVGRYFLYAGTMSEVHGAGIFLDAFGRLSDRYPDVQLRVFGTGVEVEDFTRRAEALSSRVEINPLIEASLLAPWIRGAVASLASVRPGRGYDFAFATKALTSLSCGVPVVYAGVGPLHDLIADNALGWSSTWDASEVATCMEQALHNTSDIPNQDLSRWVEQHHSLRAVAARAVRAIELAAARRTEASDSK